MKFQFLKRISGLVIIVLFSFTATQAQVIYTNVKPDSVIHGRLPALLYNLDLNNDGVVDFEFTIQTATSGRCGAECGRRIDNHVIVSPASGSNNQIRSNGSPLALPKFATIDSTQNLWSGISPQILRIANGCEGCGGFSMFGQWDTAADRYLGLKLITGGHTYYGWARLSVNVSFGSAVLTIRDYAYNSNPGKPILAGGGIVLPLTFLSFTGAAKNNEAVLTWTTVNEINTRGFDVERSKDGKSFSAVGFVKSKENTSTENHYNFTDTKLEASSNFYRLKQIDNDGNFSYSSIVQVDYKKSDAGKLTITPNPFSNSTTISFTLSQPQKVSISIFDMNGRLMKTLVNTELQQGTHQLTWDAKDEKGNAVVAGIYFLKIQTAGYTETKKIVVVEK